MYFVCIDNGDPIAHASLEAALKALRLELRAREAKGFIATFNDRLEFELSRPDPDGNGNGSAHRVWIEDENGLNVTSKDAAEAG